MQKVAVITDSTCDLPDSILEEYKIQFLPLRINFRNEEFLDRINLTPQEFYEKLKHEIPTTSLPSPQDVLDMLERLREEKYTHVIALHLSSGLSGTYAMMHDIAKNFKDLCIEVIDTKSLSMGLGFPVIEAAKSLQKYDFQATVDRVKAKIKDISGYYVIPSLEYLRKGGRIGKVAGTIGDLLQIKPIISIDREGKYFTYDKVRGRKQSLNRLFEIAKEQTNGKLSEVAILHGVAEEEARELLEKIKSLPFIKNTFFSQICPVLGVHTGPGLVGMIINHIEE
jgi:DegV family protein with EDD domain